MRCGRTKTNVQADSDSVQSYEIADDLDDIDLDEIDAMDEDEDEPEGEGNDESRPRKKART